MAKLIGYTRVSTRDQSTDRQQTDLLAAGVRRDDIYIDHGVSGAHASRPEFDRALEALIDGDTLAITTLDRLGRSTQNMLVFAEELRARGAGLRVLNLGGGDVDTATRMGSMLFTIMAALAQMEHEIKRERVTDSIKKRRDAGPRDVQGNFLPTGTLGRRTVGKPSVPKCRHRTVTEHRDLSLKLTHDDAPSFKYLVSSGYTRLAPEPDYEEVL